MKETTKSSLRVSVVLSALWLAACGGGGGGEAPIINPGPSGGVPAPAPAPAAAALGTSFTATGPTDVWHSLSSSDNGQVMVAGQNNDEDQPQSALTLSLDGGVTWNDAPSAGTGVWISSDVSAAGNRIVAVQFQSGTGMVMSNDGGLNFAPVALPAGAGPGSAFESVTISKDGSRVAAVILGGSIIVGTVAADGTVTWAPAPTGLPATANWRSIDSSPDGQRMVAVAREGAFISTTGGTSWTALPVTVAGAAVTDQTWYRVKMSDDGQTIAMAGNLFSGSSGNGIYVSRNGGTTFTQANQLVGDYSAIAMSADGGVIAATVSDANLDPTATGSVLLSSDGGTTFAPLVVNVGGAAVAQTNWRAVTLSSDATRMAVAAGSFLTDATGQIYLSTGARP